MIYWMTLVDFRRPTPEEVHESDFPAHWKDVPSPLLGVSKRVRGEVLDLLQNCPFTIRVTTHGATFDILGLSCFIAQKHAKSYGDLLDLRIEIWPPHPDRPIEMYYIWDHIRKLRDELRAVQRIPKLDIWFTENRLAKWSLDGEPRAFLYDNDAELPTDIEMILNHFACVNNVTKAYIRLPSSLKQDEFLLHRVASAIEDMEGGVTIAESRDLYLPDYFLYSEKKQNLLRASGKIELTKRQVVLTYDWE